jgi:hypothetical protein
LRGTTAKARAQFTCFTGTKVQILTLCAAPQRKHAPWRFTMRLTIPKLYLSFRCVSSVVTSVWGLKLLVYEALSY